MKIMLIIDGKKGDSYEDFKKSVLTFADDLSRPAGINRLKVVLTDASPPKIGIIPFKRARIAVCSVYQSSKEITPSVSGAFNLRGIYRVEEALPISYKKTWRNGERTPGVNLLTLFRQKPNLDYGLFLDRWHNGHTPLSIKTHPLWNYNRNVVKSNMLDGSPWYDGIVEEQVRNQSDLLNPIKFFGNPLSMLPNMINVYRDVRKFIHYPSIETYLASEYWIKS